MFCKHCGAPIADDSKFCPSCGQYLKEDSEPFPGNTDTTAETETERIEEAGETPVTPREPFREETTTNSTPEPPFSEETAAENKQEPAFGEAPFREANAPHNETGYGAPRPKDPFLGKADPSVKKNLIIGGIAIGVATLLSVLILVAGIAAALRSGTLQEGIDFFKSYEAYEDYDDDDGDENDTFPADPDEFAPNAQKLPDIGEAGNTVGNSLNSGIAADDGDGGVYYCDGNGIYHRSDGSEITELPCENGDFYSNLNKKGQTLYYVANFIDSNRQEIRSFDLDSEAETLLATTEEVILYLMAYGDKLYYATEYAIFALGADDPGSRVLYEADKAIFDMFVTEDGIYYTHEKEEGLCTLYRRDFHGEQEQAITDGYYFDFADGSLYINRMNEYGDDILCRADGNGGGEKELYCFSSGDEADYIVGMQVRNNICYYITEAPRSDGSLSCTVRAVDLVSGEECLIDKEPAAEENPFYALNIGGQWLFYYDDTFSYGLHIYELPM